jgi:hypothetical protein
MTIAVAAVAVALAAFNRVVQAYDAYRFQKGWDTCDVMSAIRTVDSKAGLIAIDLGSDDGVTTGEEVYIYRPGSKPRYIGKARIISVETQSARCRIVAGTFDVAIHAGCWVAHFTWDYSRRPFRCGTPFLESVQPSK